MNKAKLDSYIRQIAAGDRDSFRELYDYVKKSVYLFSLSIVKNHQTAEDVLQETMLTIALNPENINPALTLKRGYLV
jgi:DNA-directed RNA polymerase specialized sigma24 family protein